MAIFSQDPVLSQKSWVLGATSITYVEKCFWDSVRGEVVPQETGTLPLLQDRVRDHVRNLLFRNSRISSQESQGDGPGRDSPKSHGSDGTQLAVAAGSAPANPRGCSEAGCGAGSAQESAVSADAFWHHAANSLANKYELRAVRATAHTVVYRMDDLNEKDAATMMEICKTSLLAYLLKDQGKLDKLNLCINMCCIIGSKLVV